MYFDKHYLFFCAVLTLLSAVVRATPEPPKHRENLIDGRYQLGKLLGKGQYGIVYAGTNIHTGEHIAAKFVYSTQTQLKREFMIHQLFNGTVGFPKPYYFGPFDETYNVFIVERLGGDLNGYVPPHLRRMSYGQIMHVGESVVTGLEVMHSKGLLHRDLKPANIGVGYGHAKKDIIYLLDLHRSVEFRDEKGQHVSEMVLPATRPSVYTTPSLSSGKNYCRRDELIIAGYIIVHLLGYSLPWDCISSKSAITQKMIHTDVSTLVKPLPGSAMRKYFEYLDKLEFLSDPDYSYLRSVFQADANTNVALSWVPPSFCSIFY